MPDISDTIIMLTQLHQEVREVFESHVPDSYAKIDALLDLDCAFESAQEAVREIYV